MLEVQQEISDDNKQILRFPKGDDKKKDVSNYRDYIFQSIKYKGKFLDVIGVRINDVGSNNPLSNPNDCITPIYKFLYYLSNMYFSLIDVDDYEFFGDDIVSVDLQFNTGYISVDDLRDKLKSQTIALEYTLDDKILLQTLLEEVKLTLVFKLVRDDYDIEELKYQHNLDSYYIPLCNKNITYKTIFNEEDYVLKFTPFIGNFNAIVKQSSLEYQVIEEF